MEFLIGVAIWVGVSVALTVPIGRWLRWNAKRYDVPERIPNAKIVVLPSGEAE